MVLDCIILQSADTLKQRLPLSLAPRITAPLAQRLLSQDARTKISTALQSNPVVVFMKGTPKLPECGFSRAVIQILDLQGVPPEKLKTYNVLEDSELRSDIKDFSYVLTCFIFGNRIA